MRSQFSPSKFFISSLLILLTAACANKKSDDAPPADPVTEALERGSLNIALEDVSTDKCLDVQKYFATVRTFPAQTKVRKITSDFRMRTGYNLPRNFYLRLAAGNFEIADKDLEQTPDFADMKQAGCDSVTFAVEGHDQTYKITSGKKGTVTYKNDWGGETTVTWLSPTSVQFDITSTVGDYLCSSGSQGKAVVTQVISWGDSSILTESVSEKTISSSFLSLVSEATGYSMNSLYNTEMPADGNGERRLLVGRLKELQARPIRNELLQCY